MRLIDYIDMIDMIYDKKKSTSQIQIPPPTPDESEHQIRSHFREKRDIAKSRKRGHFSGISPQNSEKKTPTIFELRNNVFFMQFATIKYKQRNYE